MLEAIGEELRLLHPDGIERGVAMTLDQRKRPVGVCGCGLAVPHEQDGRCARRRDEPVLAKTLGRRGTRHGTQASQRDRRS